ncbi:hypothetical protein HT576_16080 [Haloterrigena sp. SYSU A121-1]|uniref:DUF7305 domain-containing protein n=1 Tax=Haloterrigena gelatinilytica TaxID=2741724 RepID=A0A8J8KCK7_9EURY|nr:hypothetical protein [Haloterrigena gelatinilytica]NUB92530.1 hypothetical protein [Haloterrigena gelatinilytica]
MSEPRGVGTTTSTERGQSTLIGVVLLIGMVAAGSLGIFLIAGDAITGAEQQSEQERVEQAFVELSHTISSSLINGDTTRSMEFNAGGQGAITKSDAGTIRIYANDEPLVDPLTMSAIEYEGDDGSIVAYQAGGVWREKGDQTQMLSEPAISYDKESQTLTLPVTTFEGDQELTSGKVRITNDEINRVTEKTHVENSTVTLEIKSEYYLGWSQYFEDEVGPNAIQEQYQIDGDLGYVEVELGLEELEGVFRESFVLSDSFDTQGAKRSDYSFEEGGYTPSEIDDEISEHVAVTDTEENRTQGDIIDSSDTISNGTHFAESVHLDKGEELTVDLSGGDATLVVDGDIELVGGDVTVRNWENDSGPDRELQIYSTGNLYISGSEVCVDTCPDSHKKHGTSGVDASAFQVYGTSNMSVGFDKGIFEGVLFAPSNDFEGPNEVLGGTGHCSDEQVCLHSNPEFFGSLVASSAHVHANANEVEHDPQTEKIDPDIHPEGWVQPPEITYLNVAVHELSIENS